MRTGITIAYVLACGAIAGSLLHAAQQTTSSGIYTEAQAKRGEALYAEKCASCHAPDLSGIDVAPALAGADFNANWNDLPLNDLFERTRISMPADNPGSLSRQQLADVIAFILSKADFPAGQTELPTDAEMLKGIRFAAKKPQARTLPYNHDSSITVSSRR